MLGPINNEADLCQFFKDSLAWLKHSKEGTDFFREEMNRPNQTPAEQAESEDKYIKSVERFTKTLCEHNKMLKDYFDKINQEGEEWKQ